MHPGSFKLNCVAGFSLLCLSLTPGTARAQATANSIAMDNAAILYSPFNWGVTPQAAKTINAGAYFKVLFSGTSCRLTTDPSANAKPYSQFWARVDGGPFTQYTLDPTNSTFAVATGLVKRKHILEVVIKSTSETIDRWVRQRTGVTFTGLLLDSGATVTAPVRKPYNILIYGDSITEGVRVNGYAGMANDTDRNDALQDYSWLLSQELPAEVGVVGFGATGINTAGSGGVPTLGKSHQYLWAGQLRSFSNPEPDLIIYNEGTNDGSSITSGMLAVVKALMEVAPNAKQLLLVPFNNSHAAELKAVVAAMGSSKVSYGDTKGFFNSTDSSDALHPYGYAHIAFIAPRLASLVAPLLSPVPKGLTVIESDNQVSLSWNLLIGATNYNVKRATTSSGPYSAIGVTTATNYHDLMVTNGTAYYYVVSAMIAGEESANSSEVSAIPHAPLQVSASLNSSGSQLSLSWPAWATKCVLYETTNLSAPVHWLALTNAIQTNDSRISLTLPTTDRAQEFFRLSAP
jgi:lysophospholipase L1-like esterase